MYTDSLQTPSYHLSIIIIIPTVVSGWVDFVCQLSQHTNGTTKCHQKSYYRTFGKDLDYAKLFVCQRRVNESPRCKILEFWLWTTTCPFVDLVQRAFNYFQLFPSAAQFIINSSVASALNLNSVSNDWESNLNPSKEFFSETKNE